MEATSRSIFGDAAEGVGGASRGPETSDKAAATALQVSRSPDMNEPMSAEEQMESPAFEPTWQQENEAADSDSTSPSPLSTSSVDLHSQITPATATFDQSELPSPLQLKHSTRNEIPDDVWAECIRRNPQRAAAETLRGNVQCMPWMDLDASGTYDPNTKPKRPLVKRRKLCIDSFSDASPQERTRRTQQARSMIAARQQGDSYVVTLKLTSPRARELLSSHEDNWPADDWNVFEETIAVPPELALENASYNLRSRNLKGQGLRRPIVDPAGEHDDLFGHPEARSCVRCRKLESRCSMLDPTPTWPCNLCQESGKDCELITPPSKKRECLECARKSLDCSYNFLDADYTGPCDDCLAGGLHCVAGPAEDKLLVRHDLDRDWKAFPMIQQRRPFISCTECRAVKATCSLRTRKGNPPCHRCNERDLECTFLKLNTAKGKRRAVDEEPLQPSPSAQVDLIGEDDNPQRTKPRWSRSIAFEASEKSPTPCDWCRDLDFGIDEPDVASLRMCARCTGGFLEMALCKHLQFSPLDEDVDIYAAFARRSAGKRADARGKLDHWCTVCSSYAFFVCAAIIDDAGDGLAGGCGLALCRSCHATLVQKFDGDIGGMIASLDPNAETYPLGLRADADLLLLDGPLVAWLSGLSS